MLYSKEKEELKTLLKTGYPLIYIVTADERPVIHVLKDIIAEMKEEREYALRTWDRHKYFYNESDGSLIVKEKSTETTEAVPYNDPMDVFSNIQNGRKHSITLLHDFHNMYDLKNMRDRSILRALKNISYDTSVPFSEAYSLNRYRNEDEYYKHTIITSPILNVPEEIEKIAYVMEFSMPGKTEVEDILSSVEGNAEVLFANDEKDAIMNSLLGLTETEIFYSIKKSMVKNNGKLLAKDLLIEKKQILKKNMLVEYIDTDVKPSDIGGMEELMKWVRKRKMTFSDQFRQTYNIDVPKGLMLTGVQGCGKSFAVKAIANDLGLPLLRLDIGTLMSKYVGDSDQNLRKAISLVEALSPCVLWIDEIEKSMPSDKNTAHETTQRMFGYILTWLQEKTSTVFVVATANNIKNLPPELLRKGRFDEIFFVDLPSIDERKDIFAIHLKKKGENPEKFDLGSLSAVSEGFTGAEIEVLINEAVLEAAMKMERINDQYVLSEIKKTNPISVTMKEQIEDIREWAAKQNVRKVSLDTVYKDKRIGF